MKPAMVLPSAIALLIWTAELSFAGPGVGDKLSISITNKFGDVFTNLTVAKILGDGLLVQHGAGQLRVKYAELPTAVRRRYQPLAIEIQQKEKKEAAANASYVERENQIVQKQSRDQAARTARSQKESLKNVPIEIPGQGWSIVILDAGQVEVSRHLVQKQFIYQATSAQGFNVSIFVEAPDGTGTRNEDVFNYYWPKAGRSPLIDPRTVKVDKASDRFVKVSYLAASIPNVNFYFAYMGKWVDVHVSQMPLRKGDESVLAEFEESLSYGK